ncbi:hypothetical protein ALC60_13662 [Trachymyrmex zeteki]|uniref:Uncharacterized protein n=1 Tax=Mycetomoellerius zeteki TaxID=64791 RepID=A0A151WHJ5_9HYME|nr:hypothetical protein ALC60_13662 [Trachymyrmex zeteki]
MSRCRVKHSKPHCRLRLLNFSPCRCDKLKVDVGDFHLSQDLIVTCRGQFSYADQVDQHDTTNDYRDCHSIQAQTARNASQKIHQVTDDREMALDQSTTEIRKCLNEETTTGEVCEKLISKQQSMAPSENVCTTKIDANKILHFINFYYGDKNSQKIFFLNYNETASRPVARVVGEIVGYRLYASLRCQRTQARSCPLSSSRAKATAAGSGGDGGGCSSGVSAVYGPVYRGKIRRKGGMVVGGGTQPSPETEGVGVEGESARGREAEGRVGRRNAG